jgi:hypothetical protein
MRWGRDRVPYEFTALATFNSERARGIVHTVGWEQLMKEEKRRFDLGLASQFPGVDYPAMYTNSEGALRDVYPHHPGRRILGGPACRALAGRQGEADPPARP